MRQATALRMDPTVEQALREVDWADLGVRLTAYAVWKARNLAWRHGRGELSLGARTPDDLAADAILKVLSGERGWDPRPRPAAALSPGRRRQPAQSCRGGTRRQPHRAATRGAELAADPVDDAAASGSTACARTCAASRSRRCWRCRRHRRPLRAAPAGARRPPRHHRRRHQQPPQALAPPRAAPDGRRTTMTTPTPRRADDIVAALADAFDPGHAERARRRRAGTAGRRPRPDRGRGALRHASPPRRRADDRATRISRPASSDRHVRPALVGQAIAAALVGRRRRGAAQPVARRANASSAPRRCRAAIEPPAEPHRRPAVGASDGAVAPWAATRARRGSRRTSPRPSTMRSNRLAKRKRRRAPRATPRLWRMYEPRRR